MLAYRRVTNTIGWSTSQHRPFMTSLGMRNRFQGLNGFDMFWAICKGPTFWMFEPYTLTHFLEMNVKNTTDLLGPKKRTSKILSWLVRSPIFWETPMWSHIFWQTESGVSNWPSLLDMYRSLLGWPVARAPGDLLIPRAFNTKKPSNLKWMIWGYLTIII